MNDSDSEGAMSVKRREFGVPDTGSGIPDTAIDAVAREMLDAEPSAGLRGRILERLDHPRRPFAWPWILGPISAAAILLISVLTPRHVDRPVRPAVGDIRLPQVAAPVAIPPPHATVRLPHRTEERIARATGVPQEAVRDAEARALPPLEGPRPIALLRIESGGAMSPTSIDVPPIELSALELSPLSESPRERP